MTKIFSYLRSTLFLGFLTITPIALTTWLFLFIINKTDSMFEIRFPGQGILLSLLLLFIVGVLTKTVFGRIFHKIFDGVINRVPFLGTVYTTLKQTFKVIFSGQSRKSFKKVVYIHFPNEHTRSLAFLTSELDDGSCLVFVPTAPNPTSGYVLRCEPSAVTDAKFSVEEAIRIIISCGALGDHVKKNQTQAH